MTTRNELPESTNIVSQSDVTATTTSTQCLAARRDRNYLLIQNKGSVAVYIKFGSASSNATEGVSIPAGGNYEPYKVPTQSVFLMSASSTALCWVKEGI